MLGRFDRAAAALEQLESIADDLGQPALRWHAAVMRCSWEQLHGNLDAADQHRERALGLGQDAVPVNAALYNGAALTFFQIHQGRGEEVIAMVEGSVAARAPSDGIYVSGPGRPSSAQAGRSEHVHR